MVGKEPQTCSGLWAQGHAAYKPPEDVEAGLRCTEPEQGLPSLGPSGPLGKETPGRGEGSPSHPSHQEPTCPARCTHREPGKGPEANAPHPPSRRAERAGRGGLTL